MPRKRQPIAFKGRYLLVFSPEAQIGAFASPPSRILAAVEYKWNTAVDFINEPYWEMGMTVFSLLLFLPYPLRYLVTFFWLWLFTSWPRSARY